MIGPIVILAAAALLGSGVLFAHRRLFTYLAAAGALFEGAFLLLTFFDRVLFQALATSTVFWTGSLILLGIALIPIKRWASPYSLPGGGKRDLVIIPLLTITLLAAWLVAARNGFQDYAWVTHGFYNGDTATFLALTQRSLYTTGLVEENPFAGNGYLEYPTLLHAAMAEFFSQLGAGNAVMHFLPILAYVQIFITIPLFFLLWDVAFPEPKNPAEHWLGITSRLTPYLIQGGLVLYLLALSWDNYIYPQSHFFLTGLFLFLVTVLTAASQTKGRTKVVMVAVGLALTFVLLFSNAVTGAAAIAAAAVFCLLHVGNPKEAPSQRGAYLLTAFAVVAAFLITTPGQAAWGGPNLSYTAAVDILRLSLPIAFLIFGFSWYLSQKPFLVSASAALVALAFITFFFSSRNIVVENASRFFYHALLVGFPLLAAPLIHGFFIARRELLHTSHVLYEKAMLWASVSFLLLFLALPAGASVISAHDNLMFKDEQVVDTALRSALWWIEDNTAPDAIFIASPHPPFAIPMFTGRSLLRTDYWLAPDDRVQADVLAAFKGDIAAREQILPHADYLLLTQDEREQWEPLPAAYRVVFDNQAVVIYQLR